MFTGSSSACLTVSARAILLVAIFIAVMGCCWVAYLEEECDDSRRDGGAGTHPSESHRGPSAVSRRDGALLGYEALEHGSSVGSRECEGFLVVKFVRHVASSRAPCYGRGYASGLRRG